MLTDYFHPHVGGGVEQVVYEISKRLRNFNCEIIIVTFNNMGVKSYEIYKGIKIYRINALNLTKLLGVQFTLAFHAPLSILNICKKENPDLIHVNNRFYFTTLSLVLLKRILKKPLITTLHLGPIDFGSFYLNDMIKIYEKIIGKYIIKNSDGIIAVSSDVKKNAYNIYKNINSITEIPNGTDLDEFTINNIIIGENVKNNIVNVVFVGRLIYNKGIQYVIEAAKIVITEHKNVKFLIVGDGPLKNDLIEKTKKWEIDKYFSFLGIVPKVSKILKNSDIFVRPSLTEGMSLTVLEAMACGLPVIVSNISGNTDLIENYKTGILIRKGNIEELVDSLKILISNSALRRSIGKNARKFVENKYSWDNTAKLTYKYYKSCIYQYYMG